MINSTSSYPAIESMVVGKKEIERLPVLGFPEPGRIHGGFQNIFASETTPTSELTFGIARFPKKTASKTAFEALHRHLPAEFYYILSGAMFLILDGVQHTVEPGGAIYIAANAEHGFCNPSFDEDLVFIWGFATDGFSEIEYKFSKEQPEWSSMQYA